MSYEITLPNGEVVEVDDSIPPVQAAANIRKQRKDLFKTDLLSKEGITGLFSTMGEAIDASVLQAKQGMHQELLDAMQKDLGKYTPGTPEYKEQEQKILQQQQIAHEYAAGAGHLQQSINEQVPNPSMPLEAAMGVVPSLVNMAPAVVTRNPFPLAQQGLEQFRAGSYSQAREQGASPESASAYANIAGPMEAITEWMPIGKLFDSLGKEATRVIIAKTIGREVASEEVNTAVEHLAEQAHVTPDRPLNEFLASYGHKATVTALQAGMQTAVTAPLIAAANRTPGSTDPTPRVLPPIEEAPPPTTPPAEKPVPPAAPQFTDTQVDLAPLLPEIAALEAQVDAGLALPEQPIASEPVEPSLSPEMQRLNARQASDTGITVEVLRNRDNFEDTNTAVPASERRVTRAMGIEGLAGLRWGETDLNKIKLTPGPVVVQVGEDSNVRPGHYMQGVVRDIYALAQEFNPEGKYVILPQDLATKAQREQAAQGGHFYQDGIHYIIPRWQTNQTEEGSHVSNEGKNKYSPYAKLDAYSTLGHEFGHSLIEDHFFQGLDANERTTLREVLDLGVPELAQALAGKLNPVAQKILADWAELRSATLENRISAKEAAMRWLSPSKLQKKVRQKELGFNAKGFTAQKFANRVGVQYQLSFDEYLAEQVAKAMFTAERMGKSETLKATFAGEMDNPQGLLDQMEARLVEFLGPLLETLQNLYSRLTAMGIAGPAQSSLEWLEQLGENARLAGERKAEGTKAKGTGKPVERPVEEPPTKNQHYATLRSLRAEGLVKTNSKVHRQLAGMLKRGDFEGFLREIEPLLKKKLDNPKDSPLQFDLTSQVGDIMDKPGVRRKIAQLAVAWGDVIRDDISVVGRRILSRYGPTVTLTRKISMPNGNSMVDMFVLLEPAYRNISEEDISGFLNGQYMPNVDEHSVLQYQYHTATNEFGVFSFPFASDSRIQAEQGIGNIKMDTKSMMPQLQGIKPRELLDMLGEFLARVRTARSENGIQTAEYEIPVVYTRTSGANPGKKGRELFGPEILGGKAGNVGYGNPQAVFARGTSGEFGVIAYNPLDAEMLLERLPDMVAGNRVTEAQILNPYVVRNQVDISTEALTYLAGHARYLGHDAVSITSPFFEGPVVLTLFPGRVQPSTGNPDMGSRLRFDNTPEEQEAASKWRTLRQKLNIPHLADGITALSNLQYWGLQMQQLGHMNPTWTWMMNFSSNLQKFYRKIGESHSRADAVVRQLQWFGKENLARMQKFTLAEYKGGEHWTELRKVDDQGHWEHVPTAKTYEKMREFGIDPESTAGKKFLRLYIEAKNALQFQMDEQQRVMYGLAARKYSSPTQIAERTQRFQEIALTYKLYRSIPFWPQHSFGKYRVQVWSSDALGKVLIYENATDSPTEAKEIEEAAQRKYPGKIVKSRIVTPNQALVSRLPTEFLDDLEVILELDKNNPDDMQKLQEIRDSMQSLYSKVPEQTYNPLKRIVDGGSTDFIKVFADFALRNANFIAKMEYRALLQQSISQAQREDEAQTFARKKAEIGRAIEFMQGTLNYAMDPQEEMATVRGVVAVSYLMLNVKTALLNFWGLTMTLAELSRELGYGKGAVTFGKAIWDATRTQGHEWGSFLATVMKGGADAALLSVTDPNWEMVNGQPTELRRALEQAKQENVLDQSYAYYLATQAMRGQLIRMASASLPGKMLKGSIDAGMSLFRGTELLIRRSTFLAMYKALQENQPELTEKERYEKAARMTSLLQGDYTKGNRPQLMRGQVMSFVTIFMTFVQTASWNAYGGMEIGLRRQEAMEGRASPPFYRSYTVQLVLLYLFAAGLEGLPGMENVLDILDALFKKWNNGKSARDGLRDMLVELDQDPMKWMRGMTFNLGGLDLSRSIGLGRVVPGTDVLATEHGKTKEFLGDFVGAASGIGGGYVQWVIDTMSAQTQAAELGLDQGSTLAKQVARMPGGIGNLFKAAQWAKIDARGPSGALLAYDEETQMAREIQYWEVTAKALGFQPASISRAQYIKGGQYDARMFWTARRKTLLDSLMQAQEIAKDREATADVRRAIEEFNKRVPSPGLRITSKTIEQSINRRRDAIEAAEEYSTVQKSLQDVYRQQLESFVESTE